MKNKLFVTFGGAIAALCPWAARAETFPTDGYMQENATYETAATYSNLGVYEGSVSATAEYSDNLYSIAAGSYLPAGSEGIGATCTAGNYCTGLTDILYDASSDQGLTSCPSDYPNSDAGASANTQCYTACTVGVANIAHATAVAGNDYYGNGTDTCYATACDNGYHTADGYTVVETDPLIDVDVSASGQSYSAYGAISKGGVETGNAFLYGLTENGTWASEFSYGTVYGRASCQSEKAYNVSGMNFYMSAEELRADLDSQGVDDATADAVMDAFAEYKAGGKSEEEMWKAAYALLGIDKDANYSTSDQGRYCFCQMTDFTPVDGVKGTVTSAPWVFGYGDGSADGCADDCAYGCANYMLHDNAYYRAFRAAVLGSLQSGASAQCEANEISITWADADAADVAANNAGMCTYDGDIRTPVKAATKPGKTFKGWRFSGTN